MKIKKQDSHLPDYELIEGPQMRAQRGYLSIYSKMAKSADKGATLAYW